MTDRKWVYGVEDNLLKKGDLLIIETGAYSDMQYHGPVRMKKTVTKSTLVEEFLKDAKSRTHFNGVVAPEARDFLPWIIKRNYAEAPDETVWEWHVGDYGVFTP